MALAAGKSLGQAVWLVIVTLIFIPGLWAKLDDLNEGGYLLEDTVVSRSDSPVTLRNSLIVAEEVTLTIEPGVELKFAPGVMLAVNGTLTARGTRNERILLTRDNLGPGGNTWPEDIRLVDERSVHKGRLQILYRNKWRGVCANFQNWTDIDVNVTCRQLGFNGGFFRFLSYAGNDSLYMLYHRPQCVGDESDILLCPGRNEIKIGSRTCENQQTVHLECEGTAPGNTHGYWWGLEFYNSTQKEITEGALRLNESSSTLEYVDIEYAGVDPLGQPVPAVRASPVAPKLIQATIKHCALDATNFTEIKAATIVDRSEFSYNRGHGFVVESHFGRVNITNSFIHHNLGMGVKAKFLDGKWPIFDNDQTFCYVPNLGSQKYPVILSAIPRRSLPPPCDKTFRTSYGQVLTFTILEMDIEPDAWAEITLIDGEYENYDPVLAKFPIINGSFPQGYTGTQPKMKVLFNYRLPSRCPTLYDCVKFTMMIDSGSSSVAEFFMNNTISANNSLQGVYLENVRNFAHVNASTITHNGYSAGIRVYGGAADIHVNASVVDYNQDNGVNITYDGGLRIFNMSSFSNNYGNGINVTFNETSVDNHTRHAKQQDTQVSRSTFHYNEGIAVRVGNYCQSGRAVVNDSSFIGNQGDGIVFDTCYKVIPDANMTNLTAGYNYFERNYGHAIKITPLINAVGRIGNNTFKGHPRHTLLIDNTDDFLLNRFYSNLTVNYVITSNKFSDNRGFYVVHLRLSQGSTKQKMVFMYNDLENNVIEGAFPTLNERARSYAVMIVDSSNIAAVRNRLVNTMSRFELSTHLQDRSVFLNTTLNWWGTIDYHVITEKIFDQFSRYNLARLEYHPVLKYDDLYGHWTTEQDQPPLEPEFHRSGNILGGRLARNFITEPGVNRYYVDKDITILPEGRLEILPGTTLEFGNALGMLVHGELKMEGNEQKPITLVLKNVTTFNNQTRVRLVGGANEMEGLLEIRPTEEDAWGTVCSLGWTMVDASVACQMQGWVVHPEDWKLPMGSIVGQSHQEIWRSRVACTELDMDITRCVADHEHDHSCDHNMDVTVKCKPPSWAGVQFLASATRSAIKYTSIKQAGLLDPTAITYTPALKIDYNMHAIENLNITHCQSTGMEIMRNDAHTNPRIAYSRFAYNLGNGLSTRGPYLDVEFCEMDHNFRNGFEYNPHLTTYEAQQLRVGIHDPEVISSNSDQYGIDLPNEGYKFVVTRASQTVEAATYRVEIRVEREHRVVMDILDYDPDVTDEKITIFDSNKASITPGTFYWAVEDDLVDFPVVSSGRTLTVEWQVMDVSSGRFAFVVRSQPWSKAWPFPDLSVRNTTSHHNRKGIMTRHYNQYSNEYLDLFSRYRWQRITLYGVDMYENRQEALHVPSITKYHELYQPTFEELQRSERMAEITYEVDSCRLYGNGGGLLAEHNHVEFSNNVWIWEVTSTTIERNRNGGFDLELPLVNLMYNEVFNHSIHVNDTSFLYNDDFEFRIDGFYCNSSIARNRIVGNLCKLGCISITGTEKDIEMSDNDITENTGKYIMKFDMKSHTPYTRWVDARLSYNNFENNRKLDSGLTHPSSSPTSFTLGIFGVQNITVIRNIFVNEMDYELVAGQASSNLENYLDVTENYWGSEDQVEIRKRIFDFDYWNNFAIAEYYPYLLYKNFGSQVASSGKLTPEFDLNGRLGGRIEGNVILSKTGSPYIVERDLTVMPSSTLRIEPGVEMQFYPNIGLLVLGSLSAVGKEAEHIRMTPVPLQSLSRWKRAEPGPPEHGKARLVGGTTENDGFVEFYNATENRWTIICDNNFNIHTAEVVCRSMGMEASNVIVLTDRLYDHWVLGYPLMHEQVIEWFWRETPICDGTETSLSQCRYRLNYNLYTCMERREYVYMRCGPRNLASEYEYWGNLRFSTPEIEQGNVVPQESFLDYVDIYGAGMLHGERVAAIQSVYRTPKVDYVRITNSMWNGYDFIAPKDEFLVKNNYIANNNGYGVGGLVLNGESGNTAESSFDPLVESSIPYNVHGLIRMCTSEKLMYVKDRVLVYYKYDFESVDCIKVIRSVEPLKTVSLRFLQLNLFNDSFYKNAVEMYNGEFFVPELKVGEILPNATAAERKTRFLTTGNFDTLGIRITASPAHGVYGFIAEVVTLPQSPGWRPDFDGKGFRQRVMRTTLLSNQRGGFHFRNAGELNPNVIIEQCRIEGSGYRMHNFTSPPVMYFNIQKSRLLTVSNNYIGDNAGGINITTTTDRLSVSLWANITNNVIVRNTHGPPLHIEGHHYQAFQIINNYISDNNVDYHNIVSLFGVSGNFSSNTVYRNIGRTTFNSSLPEQLSISQNYIANAIYENYCIGGNHTTIFLKSAKFKWKDNYIFNWRNPFEMVTYNKTRYPNQDHIVYPKIDAQYNWWGTPYESSIGSSIFDGVDDKYDNLFEVNYKNFYISNASIPGVIQGRCRPGWRLYARLHKCYLYMGASLPFEQAKELCRAEKATLARVRDRDSGLFLGEIILSMQYNYDLDWKAWIYQDYTTMDKCTAIQDYKVRIQSDCEQLLPVVCERDPYGEGETNWHILYVSLAVLAGVFFLIFLLIGFACLKSRQRTKTRLDRRNSLRASVRASKNSSFRTPHDRTLDKTLDKTMDRSYLDKTMNTSRYDTSRYDSSRYDSSAPSTMNKRRRAPLTQKVDGGYLNLSGFTAGESSTDSVMKAPLDSHRPSTPNSLLEDYTPRDYTPSRADASSYFDSDLRYPHLSENEIPIYAPKPTFDNVFRNMAYDEQSLDRSLAPTPTYGGPPRRPPLDSSYDASSPRGAYGGGGYGGYGGGGYGGGGYGGGGGAYASGNFDDVSLAPSDLNTSTAYRRPPLSTGHDTSGSSTSRTEKPPRPKPRETVM